MIDLLESVFVVTAGVSLYHILEWGYYKIKYYQRQREVEAHLKKFREELEALDRASKAKKKTTKKSK